jgi:hypothetical protein
MTSKQETLIDMNHDAVCASVSTAAAHFGRFLGACF